MPWQWHLYAISAARGHPDGMEGFEHARAYSLAGFLVVVCILVCSVLLTFPWRRNDLHPAGSCDRIVSQKRSIECPVKHRNAMTGLWYDTP